MYKIPSNTFIVSKKEMKVMGIVEDGHEAYNEKTKEMEYCYNVFFSRFGLVLLWHSEIINSCEILE